MIQHTVFGPNNIALKRLMAKQFDCCTMKIPRFVRSLIVCEKFVYTENICLWKYLVVTAKNSATYDNEFFSDDNGVYDQKSWNNGPPWIFRTVRKLNAVPSPNPQHRIWSSYLRTTPTRFRSEWRSPEKHWVSKLYGYKTFKDYKNILIDILL